MALIECSECGTEVSSNAAACPKCANPIASKPVSTAAPAKAKASLGRKIFRTGAVIVAGVIALSIWAGHESEGNHAEQTSGASPAEAATAPAAPPMALDASALYADYKANEVAADSKYKGKSLAVTGNIGTIGKDIMDDPYVTLTAENEYETVNAYFSKSRLNELAKLHKGDSITVTCKGNGMVLTSPVLDCKG